MKNPDKNSPSRMLVTVFLAVALVPAILVATPANKMTPMNRYQAQSPQRTTSRRHGIMRTTLLLVLPSMMGAGCLDDGNLGPEPISSECTTSTLTEGSGCGTSGAGTGASSSSSAPQCTSRTGSSTAGWCPPAAEASPCQVETPCPIPEMDGGGALKLLANATYHFGERATIRLRNDSNSSYQYDTRQLCHLDFYTAVGRKLSFGACPGDYIEFYAIPSGGEGDYKIWMLNECEGGDVMGTHGWHCDHFVPVPAGVYHVRQMLCPQVHSGTGSSTNGPPSSCVHAGVDIEVLGD